MLAGTGSTRTSTSPLLAVATRICLLENQPSLNRTLNLGLLAFGCRISLTN